MTNLRSEPPKTIGEAIDHLEYIREQMFVLQRSLEEIEAVIAPDEPGTNVSTQR